MTIENCKRLLKQYENIIDGTVAKPFGHKNWDLVIANAKVNAEEMRKRIERKSKLPKYAALKIQETKSEVKEDGKKSKG